MKTPTELELKHIAGLYDPVKAHEYYERHKKLKGRRQAQADASAERAVARARRTSDPRHGKTKAQIHKDARAKQRMELTVQIQGMERRLNKLEALIKKREHSEASEDRKGKAKKERAAKESAKPKTAAEKAKAAREAKQNRDKHQQREKSRDKKDSGKSGGSSKKSDGKSKKHTVAELKVKVAEVKGKIQAAKQKLAAL